MKFIKKLLAGSLLTIGIVITLLAATDILNEEADNKEGAIAAFFLFGLPPTMAGGWLAWSAYKDDRQQKQSAREREGDRLQAVFYETIKENNGQIKLLNFAMEAKISGQEAKEYLDAKAKEFNATFDVSEEGGVIYHFH